MVVERFMTEPRKDGAKIDELFFTTRSRGDGGLFQDGFSPTNFRVFRIFLIVFLGAKFK